MSEENRTLALRTSEIVNQKNPDLIEEFYPPDFVWHGPAGDIREATSKPSSCPPRSWRPSPTPR